MGQVKDLNSAVLALVAAFVAAGWKVASHLPRRPKNHGGHKNRSLALEECTKNAKGPDLACRWCQAKLGRLVLGAHKGLIPHDTPYFRTWLHVSIIPNEQISRDLLQRLSE